MSHFPQPRPLTENEAAEMRRYLNDVRDRMDNDEEISASEVANELSRILNEHVH